MISWVLSLQCNIRLLGLCMKFPETNKGYWPPVLPQRYFQNNLSCFNTICYYAFIINFPFRVPCSSIISWAPDNVCQNKMLPRNWKFNLLKESRNQCHCPKCVVKALIDALCRKFISKKHRFIKYLPYLIIWQILLHTQHDMCSWKRPPVRSTVDSSFLYLCSSSEHAKFVRTEGCGTIITLLPVTP